MSARGLARKHGRPLAAIASVSILGIIATAGFQIVASRGLGPEQFGLVAALLALVNVASIGSSALRNAVAVNVAGAPHLASDSRRDPSLVEAYALGGLAVIALIAASPWMLPGIGVPAAAFALTISALIPYFLFARAQGILQGIGRSTSVIWWSTGAQVLQLGLTLIVIIAGAGATGVLAAVFATALIGAIGASLQARRTGYLPHGRAFTRASVVVLLLTISFAWLTNSDVIFVRIWDNASDAGNYAAAAVLVKTTLILPTTLSLYLLPRFVRSRDDAATTRRGVLVMLAITLAGGLIIYLALALLGGPVVALVFGNAYQPTVSILPALALSWLPWALAQAMLVRMVAMASSAAVAALLVAGIVQVGAAALTLPNTELFVAANGLTGLAVFASMFVAHMTSRSR